MNALLINGNISYRKMLEYLGFRVFQINTRNDYKNNIYNLLRENHIDLAQFTGGEDVSPSYYGEKPISVTPYDLNRDKDEEYIFNILKSYNINMVGICRGGQFLNVMNGGKLWQDVNNHTLNTTHEIIDNRTREVIRVTSTHHQMMRCNICAEVIATAELATIKSNEYITISKDSGFIDNEVLWYEDTKCLCFQPHPEFIWAYSTREYYIRLLEEKFNFTELLND